MNDKCSAGHEICGELRRYSSMAGIKCQKCHAKVVGQSHKAHCTEGTPEGQPCIQSAGEAETPTSEEKALDHAEYVVGLTEIGIPLRQTSTPGSGCSWPEQHQNLAEQHVKAIAQVRALEAKAEELEKEKEVLLESKERLQECANHNALSAETAEARADGFEKQLVVMEEAAVRGRSDDSDKYLRCVLCDRGGHRTTRETFPHRKECPLSSLPDLKGKVLVEKAWYYRLRTAAENIISDQKADFDENAMQPGSTFQCWLLPGFRELKAALAGEKP